ncbi:hypothetical protein MTR67_026468, partial [Solanum verrucosum]
MGSKAFVAARAELGENEPEKVEPDRIEFYKHTHYKSKKGWSSLEAETHYSVLNKMLAYRDPAPSYFPKGKGIEGLPDALIALSMWLSEKDEEISIRRSNVSQLGHNDDIGNAVFHVNNTMLQSLQMKGLFGGLATEDLHDHIQNFVDVCGPFSFENITQKVGPTSFVSLFSNGESNEVVGRVSKRIYHFWEELTEAFYVSEVALQCPTHGLPNNVLLQYFYWRLDSVNKGVADQLARGGIMQQSFDIASTFLDEMTKINRAWYTKEDQVSSLNFGMTTEQEEKNQERDENMAKMMSQMKLLKKQ